MENKRKNRWFTFAVLSLLCVIFVIHLLSQNIWQKIDQDKDKVAEGLHSQLQALLKDPQTCQSLLPWLNKEEEQPFKLGSYLFPSTVEMEGFLVDFLPFEILGEEADSIRVRYQFNVKERLQYSNWYLNVVTLFVEKKNKRILACHLIDLK